MKKINITNLLLIILIFGTILFSGCNTLSSGTIKIKNISITDIKFNQDNTVNYTINAKIEGYNSRSKLTIKCLTEKDELIFTKRIDSELIKFKLNNIPAITKKLKFKLIKSSNDGGIITNEKNFEINIHQ